MAMVMTLGEPGRDGLGGKDTEVWASPASGLGAVGPGTRRGCLPEGLQSWVVQQRVRQTPASPALTGPGPRSLGHQVLGL